MTGKEIAIPAKMLAAPKMQKADFLKPASLKIVQFLGDLAFKRYWISKHSLTWVSEGSGQK
jgi:hypothetical protein